VRWPLRRREVGGRLPSLGQDYGEGHRRYVERVGRGGELWLRTKPFSAAPGHELRECLHTFAHIVERLGLGIRAQVLDVGCGPGWLSEFLARCGYWVTGVDVSEDMVTIARERIDAIELPVGEGIDVRAEFHAMPVLDLPWSQKFDAAVLYDAMHHFHDEDETLRVIRRTLVPGGRIYIHEGVRPAPGSEGERQLIEEMQQHGTLESPFDPEYLVAVLERAGFERVTRFAAIDGLFEVADAEQELERLAARVTDPPMNTAIAVNPGRSGLPEGFHARIEASGPLRAVGDDEVSLEITITNAGSAYWPIWDDDPWAHGVVTIWPYLPSEGGEKVPLTRLALPRGLCSGESAGVDVRLPRARLAGQRELGVDLVREGIAWFAEYGSPPLVVPLPADL
jgi:SAM-dependent methyltransferase